MVWVRVRVLGLSGFLYKRHILEEIGGLVGKVTKLDFQMDKGSRGKFTQITMYIDLGKPLVSQILVNGVVQRNLNHCHQFVFHVAGLSTCKNFAMASDQQTILKKERIRWGELHFINHIVTEPVEAFGLWMVAEQNSKHNSGVHQSLDMGLIENGTLNPK